MCVREPLASILPLSPTALLASPKKSRPACFPPLAPPTPGGSPSSPKKCRAPSVPSPARSGASAASPKARRFALVQGHADGEFLAKNYRFVRTLGKGSFGCVDLVRHVATGEERVCKIVKTQGMDKDMLSQMRREIRVLSLLDHPHIVKIFEYGEDAERGELILILEYISGGSCGKLLKDTGGALDEQVVAQLVRQLLTALAYCHGHGIAHRDIKPENLMVARRALAGGCEFKVIDFGLAGCDGGHAGVEHGFTTRVGTPAYMAPEVVDSRTTYTSKADLWSAGVVALELLTGQRAFAAAGGRRATFEKIRAHRGPEDVLASVGATRGWQRLSAEGQQFIHWLLEASPDRRPTASEALSHPWLVQARPAAPVGLAARVAQSVATYARAKPIARQCLHLLASRGNSADELGGLAATFADADRDLDGQVTCEELVASAAGRWDSPGRDAEATPRAASEAGSGGGRLSYAEFRAACLCTRYGSIEDLATNAFHALDTERGGRIWASDARRAFGDGGLVEALPQDRPFGVKEWVECVRAANGGNSPGQVAKLRLCVAGARLMS